MMPKLRAFVDHVKNRSDTANKTRTHIDDDENEAQKCADLGSADSIDKVTP